MAGTLILLRHGESQWNKENRFTGWVDVDLSDQGREEAKRAGKLMLDVQLLPDRAFTSYLQRAIHTLHFALDELGRTWIPETKAWQLNERHYGALQGKNKQETADLYGEDQVHLWRRGYAVMPPALPIDDAGHPRFDPRYVGIPGLNHDFVESLETTVARVVPYFLQEILPCVQAGQTVLVAAHGNSLRGLLKHLEDISDDAIVDVNIPTGVPYVYTLDASGKAASKNIISS